MLFFIVVLNGSIIMHNGWGFPESWGAQTGNGGQEPPVRKMMCILMYTISTNHFMQIFHGNITKDPWGYEKSAMRGDN